MNTYLLTVTSPDGELYKDNAIALYLRGAEGDLAVLAGHIPFITTVQAGDIRIETDNGDIKTANSNGGLLVVSENSVTLLSGSLKWKNNE